MTLRLRDRIALIALALLALAGAYYLLALKPERHRLKALNAAISAQQEAIAQARQQIATGQAAVAALRSDATQWASLGLAVPAEADIPDLLRTLERTADAEHVTIQSINLAGSSSTTTQSTPTASKSGTGGATSVPLQLSFTGGYQALADLIQRLQGLVTVSGGQVHATGPLMNVSSVALSGSANLTAQVTASIYQLPASSAATGAASTPTAR